MILYGICIYNVLFTISRVPTLLKSVKIAVMEIHNNRVDTLLMSHSSEDHKLMGKLSGGDEEL